MNFQHTFQKTNCIASSREVFETKPVGQGGFGQDHGSALRLAAQQQEAAGKAATWKMGGKAMSVY